MSQENFATWKSKPWKFSLTLKHLTKKSPGGPSFFTSSYHGGMIKSICLLQHSPFRAPSKYRFSYEIKLKGTEEEKPMYSIYFRPGSDFCYISFFVFRRPIQISYIIQTRVHVHSTPFKKYPSAQNNALGKISSLKRKKSFSQGVFFHVRLSHARPELNGGTV